MLPPPSLFTLSHARVGGKEWEEKNEEFALFARKTKCICTIRDLLG